MMSELKRWSIGVDFRDGAYQRIEPDGHWVEFSEVEKHLPKDCVWVKHITSMTHFVTSCNRKPCNKSMGGKFCPYCGGKIVEAPTDVSDE